jgi:hypothetical protein
LLTPRAAKEIPAIIAKSTACDSSVAAATTGVEALLSKIDSADRRRKGGVAQALCRGNGGSKCINRCAVQIKANWRGGNVGHGRRRGGGDQSTFKQKTRPFLRVEDRPYENLAVNHN